MEGDCTTNFHYSSHTFPFLNVGRMYFTNLGVKGSAAIVELSRVVKVKGTQ